MTVGQWILLVEVAGTVVVIAARLVGRERVTWRFAFSFVWPLVVLIVAVELLAKLVGHKFMGDKDWYKPPPRRGDDPDDDLCPVCKGHTLVPFDELEERANAVIDGKSEDLAADCRAFAPIVKHFVRKHRWDAETRSR